MSAETSYHVYRGGFRAGADVPPHWKDLASWQRDAITVGYLQGTLDAKPSTKSQRWIRDEKTNELFERQPDNSYKATYRLTPINP